MFVDSPCSCPCHHLYFTKGPCKKEGWRMSLPQKRTAFKKTRKFSSAFLNPWDISLKSQRPWKEVNTSQLFRLILFYFALGWQHGEVPICKEHRCFLEVLQKFFSFLHKIFSCFSYFHDAGSAKQVHVNRVAQVNTLKWQSQIKRQTAAENSEDICHQN